MPATVPSLIFCLPVCCVKHNVSYSTAIFPVLLCGVENLSLVVRKEYRLWKVKNMVQGVGERN
jgi:hypothetical protein